jgi:HEPN domain-containing protein
MLTTLEAIVQRLVEKYDPERIILFGSHAKGNAREDSDLDLLIVKETSLRPVDRAVEAGLLVADRAVPLDVMVYTPREMWELYWAGSPFIDEVLETGKILYMRKVTGTWLREARDDLETAAILLEHAKYRGACLHSQQAVEDSLRTLMFEKTRRPARTHDLVELLNATVAEGWGVTLSVDEAEFLSRIYRGRYPTEEGLLPHGEPTAEDAGRAVEAAKRLVDSVQQRLSEPPLS